jgi:hypothetical protein
MVAGWFAVLVNVELLLSDGYCEFVAILLTCFMLEQGTWLTPEGAKQKCRTGKPAEILVFNT